ncbi:MAG: ribonuclease P protein subunit [Candidatus Bathyarchaeota archaeon]|nr:MAG: ribonuclease P protein subunit [Candidatus Bathyarchaeota archaeon]
MTAINPRNLLRHELVGLDVAVVRSTNRSNVSITGKIVDESRNTLKIEHEGRVKTIEKKSSVFRFRLPEMEVEVVGKALVGRPEDRVKNKAKRRW